MKDQFILCKNKMNLYKLNFLASRVMPFLKIPISAFLSFCFYLGFLSHTLTIHRTAGEGGGYLCNSSLPLPPASQTRGYYSVMKFGLKWT